MPTKKPIFDKAENWAPEITRLNDKKPKRKPVWMADQAYADLPAVITVQEFSVNGVVYATLLLNAKRFNKQELTSLYKEPWKIELDFRAIKTHKVA